MNATAIEPQPELFAPLERELMIAEIDACAAALSRVWHTLPEEVKPEFWNLEKSITAFRKRCCGDKSAAKISDADVPA
jgi:hypothetical protein